MQITHKQIKDLFTSGMIITLDEKYTSPSDEEIMSSLERFVFHRAYLTELCKLLDQQGATKTAVKILTDRDFGYRLPFNYNDERDCDNAAWEMVSWCSGRGWPVGIAVIPGHALVTYINDQKEIKYVDQYTGKQVENGKKIKLVVMP